MSTLPASVPDRLRTTMMADHGQLAVLFSDTVAAFRTGDRDEATAMFARFEKQLDRHLTVEDEVLLPLLRRTHPDEAEALATDHERFRAWLLELGVGVDLHLTRDTTVAAFAAFLAEHAQREDRLMYQVAGDPTSGVDPDRVLRRLEAL
jgi:hypothetical protein